MKILITLVATGLFAVTALAGEMRTWTDSQGRTVEAEMTGVSAGKVNLKMPDGGMVPFPLANLSEADQAYVREHAPRDVSAAPGEVDAMILTKLQESYLDIKKQQTEVTADTTMDRDQKAKKLEDLQFLREMTYPTKNMSEEQFVRRAYLSIGGRIPTYEETVAYLDDSNRNKRAQLIDDLLDSELFTSHFFNYLSDLLRVREGISMNGIDSLKAGAYMDWIKDSIRTNKPWDEMVSEMVAAEGYYWENPATGYMYTDLGMELCNLSNTFTVFTGTEITCAQCHDHPFEEVYQMDFFKMAAFFGRMETRSPQGEAQELAKIAGEKRKQFEAEWKEMHKDEERPPRFDRTLQDLLGAYRYYISDGTNNRVKLPHDYKYDDADPLETVEPATYFGELVELEDHGTPREAFAWWLTSKENPRFTINMTNRLWGFVFGLSQIEPVFNIPGHLDGQAQNYELLQYLEQLMKDVDYDMKAFLRVLYNTKSWQLSANPYSPTLAQIDKGEYHFSAPVLRRMTAEQLWDSLVALTVANPEQYQKRTLEDYQELMRTDWSDFDLQDGLAMKDRFRSLGGGGMMSNAEEMDMSAVSFGRGINMVRASEQRVPSPVGSLLYDFGQSDKQLIENSNKLGSIPQVMTLLNGDMTNKHMTSDQTHVVKLAKDAGGNDGIEVVFLSVLQRYPTSEELRTADGLVRGDDYSDLIWALLNTREFMFIQ